MRAKLIFVKGSRAGTSIELAPGVSTIGRRPDQTIRFSPDEILVSSAHGSIEERDGGFVLRDVGSRNGTYVNRERVTERTLQSGDVIEFGLGGPSAQFVIPDEAGLTTTLELDHHPGLRAPSEGPLTEPVVGRPKAQGPDTLGFSKGLSSTREFVVMTYQRSKRGRRLLLMLLGAAVVGFGGLFWWQARSRSALQRSLLELGAALDSERGSRTQLETNLTAIQSGYDSLLADVERNESLDAGDVTRRFGGGVALLVFSWGFVERGGSRLLRYQLDASGRPRTAVTPAGRRVPAFGFEGEGAPVAIQGSATGFLVDSSGWIITNKHVAEPWLYKDDVAFLQKDPSLEPRFLTLRAYFPPGDKVFPLTVHAVSPDRAIDVAALRTRNQRVDAPAIRLADPKHIPSPGESLVFIGYPTGVHNLLFRVPDSIRTAILKSVGYEPVSLAAELARRNLIQPLTISGAVSDTTAIEIIHTAGTTGGGSGGPLFSGSGDAVGIHYAAVRSPIAGDPFQTQRGVRASYVWTVLPGSLRRGPEQ